MADNDYPTAAEQAAMGAEINADTVMPESARFRQDTADYWRTTPTGSTQDFGVDPITGKATGLLTKTDTGATLSTIGNAGPAGEQTWGINRSTDIKDIGQWAPGLKDQWQTEYGEGILDQAAPGQTAPGTYIDSEGITRIGSPTGGAAGPGAAYSGGVAQGGQPGGVPPNTLTEQYGIKEGGAYVTPESMVSNQLNTLLASDSPYIRAAKERAAEASQARGMLDSSMAAGAGERAAIEAGLPIASQDASTFGTANLTQQQAENLRQQTYTEGTVSGDLKVLQTQLDQSTLAIQNSFTEAMKQVDFENNVFLTDMQQQWDRGTRVELQNMSDTLASKLQSNDISQQQYNNAMTSMSQISQNTQTAIAQLLADDAFLLSYEEDPSAANDTFNDLLDSAGASMRLVGSAANMDPARLDILIGNYTSNRWGED